MNSVIEQLLEGGPHAPHIIIMRMKNYIGKTVITLHTNETLPYEIQDCSFLPLSDITVHKESIERFYERKHGITLQYTDLPVFICRGGNLLPPELTFFVETPIV
jgi:hypothetical protein